MNIIHQIITSHNKTVLSNEKSEAEQTRPCTCRNKTSCPHQGKCLQKGVIYQAIIMQRNTEKQDTYIRVTKNEFKTCYNQHTSSFKLEHRSSATTLSEHIWTLKKNKIDYIINWEILDKALPYSASSGRCNLCIGERINISYKRPTLNKRRELFCTSPHSRKCLLQNAKLPNEDREGTRKEYTPDDDNGNPPTLENG